MFVEEGRRRQSRENKKSGTIGPSSIRTMPSLEIVQVPIFDDDNALEVVNAEVEASAVSSSMAKTKSSRKVFITNAKRKEMKGRNVTPVVTTLAQSTQKSAAEEENASAEDAVIIPNTKKRKKISPSWTKEDDHFSDKNVKKKPMMLSQGQRTLGAFFNAKKKDSQKTIFLKTPLAAAVLTTRHSNCSINMKTTTGSGGESRSQTATTTNARTHCPKKSALVDIVVGKSLRASAASSHPIMKDIIPNTANPAESSLTMIPTSNTPTLTKTTRSSQSNADDTAPNSTITTQSSRPSLVVATTATQSATTKTLTTTSELCSTISQSKPSPELRHVRLFPDPDNIDQATTTIPHTTTKINSIAATTELSEEMKTKGDATSRTTTLETDQPTGPDQSSSPPTIETRYDGDCSTEKGILIHGVVDEGKVQIAASDAAVFLESHVGSGVATTAACSKESVVAAAKAVAIRPKSQRTQTPPPSTTTTKISINSQTAPATADTTEKSSKAPIPTTTNMEVTAPPTTKQTVKAALTATTTEEKDKMQPTSKRIVRAIVSTTTDDEEDPGRPKMKKTRKALASTTTVASVAEVGKDSSFSVLPLKELTDDETALLQKHATLRETSSRRADELLQRCRNGLPEEDFQIDIPTLTEPLRPKDDDLVEEGFPDFAVATLAAFIEGKKGSLSVVTDDAVETLHNMYHNVSLTAPAVAAKIKILATRKNYIKNASLIVPLTAATSNNKISTNNIFEDTQADLMWRWEVAAVDLLPVDALPMVKRARAARKKISAYFAALAKLVTVLNEADKLLLLEQSSGKVEMALAKISVEEERVLKYEREEEKNRLVETAKQQKEAAARVKKELENQQRVHQAEEKQRERDRKKVEALATKNQKKIEADAVKALKAAVKEEKEQKERAQKQTEIDKQKKFLLSFFTKAPTKPVRSPCFPQETVTTAPVTTVTTASKMRSSALFDSDAFRSSILPGSCATTTARLFSTLSRQARTSRKRRTKLVTVPVFVTVYPDGYQENPFAAQPYAEQLHIQVKNRYKLLSFHEDVRPAYYGTWSKLSTVITGCKPLAKDDTVLDYDVDSEGEWEEGDDDIGEELGVDDNADIEDEDDDKDEDEDEDGWLAADDEVDDELDEETKLLQKKKKSELLKQREALAVCLIGPDQGKPLARVTPEKYSTYCRGRIEGFEPSEAFNTMESLTAIRLHDMDLFLDAFPPALMDEVDTGATISTDPPMEKASVMTDENMKCFARFVHNCTLGSKDKVVDELLQAHKSVTSSRAQALRLLDSIAEKKKHPCNGTLWEVKKDILANLGLDDLVAEIGADVPAKRAMQTIARFVHNCTTASKEKIVDDLRSQHESVTSSRAEAMRILLSIATKEKHPVSGYYWKVARQVCEELGLDDLLSSSCPPPVDSKKLMESSTSSVKGDTSFAFDAQSEPFTRNDTIPKSNVGCVDKAKNKKDQNQLKRSSEGSVKLLAAFVKKIKLT